MRGAQEAIESPMARLGLSAINESVTLRPVFASRPGPLGQETPTASRPAYAHEHPLREESAAAK
jgi:hypothetical protein